MKASENQSESKIEKNNCDCDDDCRKKAKRKLLLIIIILSCLFLAGYFLRPGDLRIIWLVVSGSGAVVTLLLLYLVNAGVVSAKC